MCATPYASSGRTKSLGKQVVSVDGQDIPTDADRGIVPALRLIENVASLCVAQIRADLLDVVDMPGNLDGVGRLLEAFGAFGHGLLTVLNGCAIAADA